MVGVGDNQGRMFLLPSVVGPHHSRRRGPRRLDLLEALCWNPQPLAGFSPPPKQHPPWKADRREGLTEWMSERKKQRKRERGREHRKERKEREWKRNLVALRKKKKEQERYYHFKIYSIYISERIWKHSCQIFELFIYLYPFLFQRGFAAFCCQINFPEAQLWSCYSPALKNPNTSSLPVKWSPISLASYLRPSIIWPQTSSPTLSCISSL